MTVAVPCDRVVSVAVEIEPDRVERTEVAVGDETPELAEQLDRFGPVFGGVPPHGEPGLVDDRVVHRDVRPLP